jgi:hypothetical protein
MNKQEIEYLKRQLENELEFYTKSLALLEEIEISPVNKRAERIINMLWDNKIMLENRLKSL